jgi:hypothetical protein
MQAVNTSVSKHCCEALAAYSTVLIYVYVTSALFYAILK